MVEESKIGQNKKHNNVCVKDRERNCVMGAIMHQIDANNYVVTVAVVDKYGELMQTRDFMRLLPLRPRPMRKDENNKPIEEAPRPKTEEEIQHENDKSKLIELIKQYSVDLITVGANCLEARRLKTCLKSMTEMRKH